MFNLEQAISEWRHHMLATGIKAPIPLEELESHLREDIARHQLSGISEEQSFHLAQRQMGSARLIENEFKKVQTTTPRQLMIQTLVTLTALFGTVFGGAMVLPALGNWARHGVLHLWPLLLGVTLAVITGAVAIYCLQRQPGRRSRMLVNTGILAAGGFYVVPLIQSFFLSHIDWTGWAFCLCLAGASCLFFGKCYRLNQRHSSI